MSATLNAECHGHAFGFVNRVPRYKRDGERERDGYKNAMMQSLVATHVCDGMSRPKTFVNCCSARERGSHEIGTCGISIRLSRCAHRCERTCDAIQCKSVDNRIGRFGKKTLDTVGQGINAGCRDQARR